MARKKGHTCGNVACFHGAFSLKSKAKAKARKVRGARVKGVRVGRGDYRYVVITKK